MDFYDTILQYDFEVQNKISERLNEFLKFINLIKNNYVINQYNNKNSNYKHITNLIEEINDSNKFKKILFLNNKKNILLRMSNKNKTNTKYYIYAKDSSQDSQRIDINDIENTIYKKESNIDLKINSKLKLENFNNQKIINYNNREKNISELEEEKNINKFKSDVNKIVCDMIKENVKNLYIKKLNEFIVNKNKLDACPENIFENNNYIKKNNFIKINLPFNEIYKKDRKEVKEISDNLSHEKKSNLSNNIFENKQMLRNSITNNSGKNLKIKIYKNDLINNNNLNNKKVNNINNLLIINKKIKSAKNENNNNNNSNNKINNIFSQKNIKIINKNNIIKKEKDDIIIVNHNNTINNNENSINKNKMILRNTHRIQIKSIKFKNNPLDYNLTNICQKKFSDIEISEKNNLKKIKIKHRQCASPGDIGLTNRKLNLLKFKIWKNSATPDRNNIKKSNKKLIEKENQNEDSITSLIREKKKDIYSYAIKFNSVRKKKICDEMIFNEFSQLENSKKEKKNNFFLRNYNTNLINRNININNINSITRESISEFFTVNKNNNHVKKSLSKESDSHSLFPWNYDNSNLVIDKSNYKGKIGESFFNKVNKKDKKNNNGKKQENLQEFKKLNKHNNIFNNEKLIKNKKNKKTIINENNKQKGNLIKIELKEVDTINNKEDLFIYKEGKGKKKTILSNRVHIRGVNSSKNFNKIFEKK